MTRDIGQWLAGIGLDAYHRRFVDEGIGFDDLPQVTDLFLRKTLGISDPAHRRRILDALKGLEETGGPEPEGEADTTVHLSGARNQEIVAFCRRLAKSPQVPWVELVIQDWPGPIAHEYFRLRELLAEGQIIGALWQLKDVAEVLIRFPALVMARDVLEHSPGPELPREVRRHLLGPPMTMGSWLALAVKTLAKPIRQAPDPFAFAEIAGLFRKAPAGAKSEPKLTALAQCLDDLTQWRNEAFGHGAFRLRPAEFQSELAEQVAKLNRALAEHAGLWQGMELRILAPDGEPLRGAQSIRLRHDQSVPGAHQSETEALWLTAEGRELQLSPYLALRRCTT